MTEPQRFSINVAEIDCIESDGKIIDEWPHAFLCLVDEVNDSFDPNKVRPEHLVEQLHFEPQWNFRPKITRDVDLTIRNRFGRTQLFPILGGHAEGILPVWQHMNEYAESLIDNPKAQFGKNPRHGEFDTNCRTMIDAVLQSAGLILDREFTKSAAGMGAPNLFNGVVYDHGLVGPNKG